MKKKLFSVIVAFTMCLTTNATLIHINIIKNGGTRGYKNVSSYEGLFITINKCKDPGTTACNISARAIDPNGNYFGPISLTADAYKTASGLPQYAKDFINEKQTLAFNSLERHGVFSSTFLVNGEQIVLTAKFKKLNDGSFKFKVASNSTYSANLIELQNSDDLEIDE